MWSWIYHSKWSKWKTVSPSCLHFSNVFCFKVVYYKLLRVSTIHCWNVKRIFDIVNLFHATGLFPYPLKTSENLWFSDVFRGYRKRLVAWNWISQQFSKTDTGQAALSVIGLHYGTWCQSQLWGQKILLRTI